MESDALILDEITALKTTVERLVQANEEKAAFLPKELEAQEELSRTQTTLLEKISELSNYQLEREKRRQKFDFRQSQQNFWFKMTVVICLTSTAIFAIAAWALANTTAEIAGWLPLLTGVAGLSIGVCATMAFGASLRLRVDDDTFALDASVAADGTFSAKQSQDDES